MNIEDEIDYFVPLVNKELGRENKNEICQSRIKNLMGTLNSYSGKGFYLLYMIYPDLWGDLEMSVLSFYIEPDYRKSPKVLKHLMDFMYSTAQKNSCKSLVMGSHFPNAERFYRFLKSLGFEVSSMRKKIN